MTTFMNLTLPEVGTTIGPQWATELNAAITTIDSHDHSSGKGTKVTPAGLNINSELSLGNQALSGVGRCTFQNLAALDSTNVTTYFKDGDFYVNDNSGNQIRMTSGGALNVGSVGGIGGDYGSTAATAFYTDASKTYFFQDSTAAPGKMDVGDISASKLTSTGSVIGVAGTFSGAVSGTTGTFSGAVSGTTGTFSGAVSGTTGTFSGLITANAGISGTTGTFSGAVSGTTGTFSGLITANAGISGTTGTFSGLITANAGISGTTGTFSGNTSAVDVTATGNMATVDLAASGDVTVGTVSGPGTLPLGAIIPIASNLTGATAIPVTGTVDSNGFQYCDGAAIAGAATMSGTIYDLTDERFLVGSTVAGSTGGSNAITPAGTMSGTQSMSHTHTGPSHTHTGPSHTHSAGSITAMIRLGSAQILSKEVSVTSWTSTDTAGVNSTGGGSGSTTVGVSTQGTSGSGGTGSTGSSGTGSTGSGGVTVSFSNGTFTGSSANNRPQYLSVVYLMRVK